MFIFICSIKSLLSSNQRVNVNGNGNSGIFVDDMPPLLQLRHIAPHLRHII